MATEIAVIEAHGRHAQGVRFTNDGKLLISGGQDARICLRAVPEFTAVGTIEGHANSVNSLSLTADDKLLATGSTDGTVRIWSFPDGRCLHVLKKLRSAVFAPTGDRFATVSTKDQVTIWDTKSASPAVQIPSIDKRTVAVAFSPDGRSLLIGGTGTIHRVAVADGKKVGELTGHKVIVACLRISPDGKWLASTGGDGYLRFWSTKDWTEVRSVKLAGGGVMQFAFAPKSDAVTVAADYLIQTYAVKDGKVLDRIELPLKGIYGVAISPDGKYLANAAADGRVRVWRR